MTEQRPTRHEQAHAILQRRAWQLASQVLGRRATNAEDFAEAFNVERIDLVAAIPTPEMLMALGRNLVGPADGLYVLEEDSGGFRIYVQEQGESRDELRGLDFDEARHAVIDRVIQLGGIPFVPQG